MIRSLATVGGFTFLSRITGMVREMIIARYFGTAINADAFYAAFRLPNMFRRVFGEGAFNSAFVPLFNRELEEGSHSSAERFASNAFSWLGGVLLIGTVVVIPGMPIFAKVLVPFFSDEALAITVSYGRIMFSYLLCLALSAQLSGVLNSLKIFAMPAFAPVLLNLLMILALVVVVPMAHLQGNLDEIGRVISWAVFVAGIAQLILLWVTCRVKGMRIRVVRPKMNPRMRRLLLLMGPGVLAAGVQQVNILIGQQIASQAEGMVGAMSYADRLYQMPNGMIGAAFGVVLLPEISRLLRAGHELRAKETMSEGVMLSMLLTLPAAAALALVPVPFVRALYEGGQFGAESIRIVASATVGFALGVPAFVLIKVLQAGYFARENTKEPLKMAAVAVAVNIVFSLLLFPWFKALGIALATSIAAWVNVILLARGLRGKLGVERAQIIKLGKILFSSLVMGAVVWLASVGMESWISGAFWQKWVAVLLLVGTGGSLYGLLVLGLRATSLAQLKAGFKR